MAPRNKLAPSSEESNAGSDCSLTAEDSLEQRRSSKLSRSKKYIALDKNSEEYRRRRERNNLAVKKSRTKSKLRTQQTLDRVNQLRAENEMLEAKIKILTKELSFLKDLFLAHAGSAHGQNLTEMDLSFLNEDSSQESGGIANNEAIENDHKYSSQDAGISTQA